MQGHLPGHSQDSDRKSQRGQTAEGRFWTQTLLMRGARCCLLLFPMAMHPRQCSDSRAVCPDPAPSSKSTLVRLTAELRKTPGQALKRPSSHRAIYKKQLEVGLGMGLLWEQWVGELVKTKFRLFCELEGERELGREERLWKSCRMYHLYLLAHQEAQEQRQVFLSHFFAQLYFLFPRFRDQACRYSLGYDGI